MNILVAPNSMKGSLNAFDFASTVEEALLAYLPEIKVRKVPVADGGDFTGEILAKALNAKLVKVKVHGPLSEKLNSKYFISVKTAIIEMADASGMKLIDKSDLNPLKTSSFGTGELIADAILKGCSEILLAVGGSATVDGGMGMMNALEYSFFDENGNELSGNGNNLGKVDVIKVPKKVSEISVKIICDVDNPLLGKNGAAAVFGPQKGATPEMVVQLEDGLKNWSQVLKRKTGKDIASLKGAGAAGGISIPLISFFNAEIVRGSDFILSVLNFDEHVKWADLVITGEGKLDTQTLNNKAPFAVASWAKKQNKPVFAFGGSVEKDAAVAFDGVFSISSEGMDIEYAMKNAKKLLYDFTLEFAKNMEELVKKVEVKREELNRVLELIRTEKPNEAKKIFDEIVTSETVEYYLVKGNLEQKFQNWGNAMNAFLKVIEFDPENIEAQNNLHIIQSILNFWNPEMFNP